MVNIVKNSGLIEYGDKIVVGVSGGPDSVTLLHVLSLLRNEFDLTLFVVHINHSLRDVADFEEDFVRNFSKSLNIDFFSKKVDVLSLARNEKKSAEETARNIRYAFFDEVAEKTGANKIAVAHNANDNAETVLMNLIRGSGSTGLCGISTLNGKIIRPLLYAKREEIEKYVKENNLTVMVDKTNSESVYTRNKIRNDVIPNLLEINPDFISAVSRCTDILKQERAFLDKIVSEKYKEVKARKDEVILSRSKLLSLDGYLKKAILRRAVFEFRGSLTDVGFFNLDNAIKIIDSAQSGAVVTIFDNLKIKISYDSLIFFEDEESIHFNYELKIPGTTYIKELNAVIKAEVIDAGSVPDKFSDRSKCFFDIAKTGKKLYVRERKEGDSIYLSGMNGKKSIKKYFSDIKLPEGERNRVPIVTNGSEVVWIAGFRSSGNFLKDKSTREVIILEYGENI